VKLSPAEGSWVVEDCRIHFGGMAPTVLNAQHATLALMLEYVNESYN
jgi:hypothetical protein